VIFGAKDPEYQKRRNLSAEAIALCRLICQMTEPLQKRPGIDAVLKKIREIRLGHIKKRMIHFMPALGNDYNDILNKLYSRRGKLSNATHALDDLDILLLRAVDTNEKNRPLINEMKEYLKKLNNTLNRKKTLNTEIQEHYLKKPNNTQILAKKLQRIEKKLRIKIQECFFEQENVAPEPQNGTLSSLARKNKPIVHEKLPLFPSSGILAEKCLRHAAQSN
ncbi:MAG TPA: hypothetical protein VNK03_05140, partial [Gammaproteobacteria bacterium]|nr:hypothetical protein [Gammaproteobacteria bacterium]